jgi:hypothetical protein
VSAELEGRIKASLSAYADLVEEPEDVALPVRRSSRTATRRWRAPLLVAAAVASAVTVAVSVWPAGGPAGDTAASVADSGGGAGSAESAAGAAEDQRGESQDGTAMSAPEDAAVAIGVPVPFDLYTHCGVLGADIGGVWFAADPPLVKGPANPPPDRDNPYQAGTLTLLSEDEAVFTDDAGHEVRLRADEGSRPPPCD